NGRAVVVVENVTKNQIENTIAEVIINEYKAAFLKKSLILPIENEINKAAFIKALTTFDRDSDKIITLTQLNITNKTEEFLLDSFFNFKLEALRKRWEEVCKLANENTSYLVCSQTFVELLRFLIKNLESKCNEVHLFSNNNTYQLLNQDFKPIKPVYSNEEVSAELDVIQNLISLSPKKIVLHLNTSEANSTINYICNLFENNVEILQSN
ncbi:MAG: putative sporulation protein YtxC, partial [Firmicutes bacterium]|nr:putative sporulation protein YtxC [Bacillota bacterium]